MNLEVSDLMEGDRIRELGNRFLKIIRLLDHLKSIRVYRGLFMNGIRVLGADFYAIRGIFIANGENVRRMPSLF